MEMAMPMQWTMGGVFAALVTASATTATLRRMRPSIDLAEVRLRVRSWWVMAAVFIVALAVHPAVTLVFLAAVGVAAVVELHRATGTVVLPVAVAATVAAYGMAYAGAADLLPGLVVAAGVAAALVSVVAGVTQGFTARVGSTMVAAAVGAGLAHLAGLLALPATEVRTAGGAGLLLWLVIVAQGGDVAQFLSGKAFGRTKLAPLVSPNKTVAGLMGGIVVAAALGSGLGALLTAHSWVWGLLLGVAVAIAGTAGDLMVSAIKRDCGVKDCGRFIPGHGGILDRVDSLILAAPLVVLVVAG